MCSLRRPRFIIWRQCRIISKRPLNCADLRCRNHLPFSVRLIFLGKFDGANGIFKQEPASTHPLQEPVPEQSRQYPANDGGSVPASRPHSVPVGLVSGAISAARSVMNIIRPQVRFFTAGLPILTAILANRVITLCYSGRDSLIIKLVVFLHGRCIASFFVLCV